MTVATAPASSANLGPGFDVLALALDLTCRVSVTPGPAWEVRSEGRPVDDAAMALVRRAVESASAGAGPFTIEIESDIPIARGLGSSAALIVAVAAGVRAAVGASIDPVEVCRVAAAVEGHPDNVAAAAHGGAVMVSPSGLVHHLTVHPSLRPIVAVPDAHLSTRSARAALADVVDIGVASRTAARLAFLLEGLRTGDPAVLAEAAGDELHEERRAILSPLTGRMIEVARAAGAAHVAWSGAGPSVLAMVRPDAVDQVTAALRRILEGKGSVLQPSIAATGFAVEA